MKKKKQLSVIEGEVQDGDAECLVLDGDITQGEINHLNKHNITIYLKSRFQFLKKQDGLRPMCLHVLLGTAGSGKSTLSKTIILDVAKEERVLIWLTEESKNDFLLGYLKLPGARESLANLAFVEEESLSDRYTQNWDGIVTMVNIAIDTHKPALFVMDNITTSVVYESMKIAEHNEFIRYLKFTSKKKQFATLIIAHTGKGIVDSNRRLIGLGDVKGTSALENKAEYFYVYQRICIADQFYPFVRVIKSRYHQNNASFFLKFNKFTSGYESDNEVAYTQLESWFTDANKR